MPNVWRRSRSTRPRVGIIRRPQCVADQIAAEFFEAPSGNPPAISGTGGITSVAASIAIAALLTFSGPSALAAPTPSLAASSAQTFSASSAVIAPTPSLAGSGTTGMEFSGTAAIMASAASLFGISEQTFTGADSLAALAPSLASNGAEAFNATVGTIAPSPGLAVPGVLGFSADGEVSASTIEIAGTSLQAFAGAGGLTAPTASLLGSDALAPPIECMGSFGVLAMTLEGSGAVTLQSSSPTPPSGITVGMGGGWISSSPRLAPTLPRPRPRPIAPTPSPEPETPPAVTCIGGIAMPRILVSGVGTVTPVPAVQGRGHIGIVALRMKGLGIVDRSSILRAEEEDLMLVGVL